MLIKKNDPGNIVNKWYFQLGVVALGFWLLSKCSTSGSINNINPTATLSSKSYANTLSVPNTLSNSSQCLIKGNISYGSGEKIYHLPGDSCYDLTKINTSYGERWFCTEQEALSAGWRHADPGGCD